MLASVIQLCYLNTGLRLFSLFFLPASLLRVQVANLFRNVDKGCDHLELPKIKTNRNAVKSRKKSRKTVEKERWALLLFTLSWHSSAPSSKVQPAPQICFQGETVVTSKNHHHQQAPVHHYHPHYQQNKDLHRKLFTAGVSNELARLFLHVPEANIKNN